jgi:DNA-binding protein HU-beta
VFIKLTRAAPSSVILGLMSGQVRITTGFPSAAKTAKKLGVSKKVARDLSLLAERSLRTGEFLLPGVGRIVRTGRRARMVGKPAAGKAVKTPGRKVVKFRVAKEVKDATANPEKK